MCIRDSPIVQALKAAGNRVITVLAGRTKELRSEERRVGKEQKTSLITAILDETLKVTDGSRVRIRLLDDIMTVSYTHLRA